MKVYSLMNTPEADGLFQKGIIQSGVIDGFGDTSMGDGTEIVKAMLEELGYGEDEVEKLETVPYYELAEAYNKVSPKIAAKGCYVGGAPKANDWYVGDPREVGFTEAAKKIPVMIGSVFGEFDFGPALDGKYEMSRRQNMELLTKRFGDDAKKIAKEFAKAYPDKCLSDALSVDLIFRLPTKDFAMKKAVHPEAPTYSYMFSYEFPFDGGKTAWHCAEIPFVFHNIDRVPICNEPGVTDRLQERMCTAWVNFARYGNPSTPSLPEWPACTPGDEVTMIFDVNCEVRHNYDNKLMELMKGHMQKAPFEDSDDDEEEEKLMLH